VTQAFYEDNVEKGLKFTNLSSLFGHVMVNAEPVIANNPEEHPSAAGVPEGHPPLNHFLGIPFFEQGGSKMNGMVGIANKPGGYTEEDIAFLEPFVVTCSNLIQAYGAILENKYLINTLEEKVEERTNELSMANVRLEEANRKVVQNSAAQLEHFACMSHEIRTPLNCIIGISSLLIDTELNSMQEESLRMMITSGDLLVAVVNDVLDYSKLSSGKVDISISRTNLQDTLDAVVHSINLKARERRVRVLTVYDAAVPEFTETDSRRLQQILYNLLGNAVKFSKEGGTVELKLEICDVDEETDAMDWVTSEEPEEKQREEKEMEEEASHEETKQSEDIQKCPHPHGSTESGEELDTSLCPFLPVSPPAAKEKPRKESKSPAPKQPKRQCLRPKRVLRFVVKDNGKGIERKDFKKIFQPFLQDNGSETERVYGGTGLGLAITSKLTAQLGGRISVDSEIGKWSEFTLDFPFEGETSPVEKIGASLYRTRIFQVCTDPTERLSQHMLDQFKIEVTSLDSCDALVQELAAKPQQNRTQNGTAQNGSQNGSDRPPISFDICLVQEDLYDAKAYNRFADGRAGCILLTSGPTYKVRESSGHFRSLVQMLPSVLMQSMASYVDSSMHASLAAKNRNDESSSRESYEDIRVLVAEDNIINQKVLHRMLTRLGLKHIDMVDNGKKAVDESGIKEYDIVFMDMEMPVMHGLEACKLIVARRKENKIPKVVFVTAHVSASFETQAEEAGGDGFISKPYDLLKIEGFFRSIA
jgi:signal transduction histidine kinase